MGTSAAAGPGEGGHHGAREVDAGAPAAPDRGAAVAEAARVISTVDKAAEAPSLPPELVLAHKEPPGWPRDVAYSHQQDWSKVPAPMMNIVRDLLAGNQRRALPLEVRGVPKGHAAYPGAGLFAAQRLPAGVHVVDYAGHLVVQWGKAGEVNRSNYIFNLFNSDGIFIDVDANSLGNESRFVNHYEGIRDKPNCTFRLESDERTGARRVGVFTLVDVPCGDELLVDYGGRFWQEVKSGDKDHDDDYGGPTKRRRT